MKNLIASALTLVALLALPLHAAPTPYALDRSASSVGFDVMFGQDKITGTIPIREIAITLDFDRPAQSSVVAVLDTSGAEASFAFATQAMRGPQVLASDQHPTLTFRSKSMRFEGTSAEVTGDLTIRGVTRPVTLRADVYRQKGTDSGDRSRMSFHLTGAVNRSDFGATGWDDLVSDQIALQIIARITRAN